ncbi:MAG: ribonuclease HI family protein [Chloroflexi bacterium]|nr:ribonuclease HI family protein [Chloroflexota bacterium]
MKDVEEILAAISALSAAERRELCKKLVAMEELTGGLPEARQPALAFDAGQLEGRADYILVFDGGSVGNPGPGYGSYALIRASDGQKRVVRLDFGGEMTNNEAEYDTLIAGLNDLIQKLTEAKRSPADFSIEVRGDSSLVINQVSGVWKAKDERMRARRNQVRELLDRFAAFRLGLQPRQESVKILGH